LRRICTSKEAKSNPTTTIHDRSLPWLGTGISIKSGGVKLVTPTLFTNIDFCHFDFFSTNIASNVMQHLRIVLLLLKATPENHENVLIQNYISYDVKAMFGMVSMFRSNGENGIIHVHFQ
jgi:hypothetical protein